MPTNISLKPTILVGFGTSGAKIVEAVQQYMYETFKLNSLPIFGYIAIETDKRYAEARTPKKSDIRLLRLDSGGGGGDFKSYSHLLEQLKYRKLELDWVSDEVIPLLKAKGEGAGNVRLAGRLLLWGHFETVYKAIAEARMQITRDSAINETRRILQEKFQFSEEQIQIDNKPIAIVAGTLLGGSCSGAFIDLGHLVRHIVQIPEGTTDEIYGLFLTAPTDLHESARDQLMANCYGALEEHDYFLDSANTYHATWPYNNIIYTKNIRPYAYTYFVSQDYGTTDPPIKSVTGLYKLAGLKLFCDLIGVEGLRAPQIVNHFSRGWPPNFTFGMAVITHPKYSLSEYVSCQVSSRLCERWANESRFKDWEGKTLPIQPTGIVAKAAEFWEGTRANQFKGALAQTINNLEYREEGLDSVGHKIIKDAEQITSDQHFNVTQQLTGAGETYYNIISDNKNRFVETLNTVIRDEIKQQLERTQSIHYAIEFARGIEKAMQDTLKLWQAFGIGDQHEQWASTAGREYARKVETMGRSWTAVKNIFLFGQRQKVLEDRIDMSVDALKRHKAAQALEEVKIGLQKFIDKLEKMKIMIERVNRTLSERQSEIKREIEDDTLPICRVWAKGDFTKDCNEIDIANPDARDIFGEKFHPASDGGTTLLWETLETWFNNEAKDGTGLPLGIETSEVIKQAYQDILLEKIDKQLKCDLLTEATTTKVNHYFGKVKKCNLSFDNLGQPVVANKFLIASATIGNSMVDVVNRQLQEDFDTKHIKSIPFLDSMIIYYREEAFKKVKQINNYNDMKHSFENAPLSVEDDIRAHWGELSEAYATRKKGRVEGVKNIITLILDFFIQYSTLPDGTREPFATQTDVQLPISIAPGKAPVLQINLPGQVPPIYLLILNPANEKQLNELIDRPKVVKRLVELVSKEVSRIGQDRMTQLWSGSVMPDVLNREGETVAQYKNKIYLGEESRPGLITQLLENKVEF